MLKVLGINTSIILEIWRKAKFTDGEFLYRRIALRPEQITQVEASQIDLGWFVTIAWKEPNSEVIKEYMDSRDEAIWVQDEILQMIHNITFRERYG